MTNQFTILSGVHIRPSVDAVIAMGVYSGDKPLWIEQAVNSLLCQTYKKHIIVIVIDGFVSDEILTYLIDTSKSIDNILLVKSPENKGLSACMNFVIDWTLANLQSAEFFFRMDADDISEPNRLEKQRLFLQKHPTISILGSGLTEVNEAGIKVGKRSLPCEHGEILRFLPKRCSINHPTVAIRLSVFKKGYRYRENLMNTQDYFLWAELAAAGFKFGNLNDKLLKFRRVNDFYKRRGLSKSINEFKARLYAMKVLNKYSLGSVLYACAVLTLRLMPAKVVKIAYKIDRYFLNKRVAGE